MLTNVAACPSLWEDEGTVSLEILDHYRTALESKLEGYEAILSKQKYMAGNVSDVWDGTTAWPHSRSRLVGVFAR